MRMILAGIAAAALTAGMAPAQVSAQPGQGNGKGNDKAQGAAHSGGSGKAQGNGNNGNGAKGPGNKPQVQQNPSSNGIGNGNDKRPSTPDRSDFGKVKANGNGQSIKIKDDRGYERHDDRDGGFVDRIARLPYSSNRGLIEGCPPGLAKKNPPCVPPGLAKKSGYFRSSFYRPSFFGIGGIGDGRYYYDNGYLYRMGGNDLISAFIPLLGGALSVGNSWPGYYEPTPLAPYYVDYYDLGTPRGYRYADNVVYRVNPETAAITSIAALLTGDDFSVGQPMPAGYDVYNVPYGYRDRYYDRPDAYYRYADGYVYQVDPETRLITAAIELLM